METVGKQSAGMIAWDLNTKQCDQAGLQAPTWSQVGRRLWFLGLHGRHSSRAAVKGWLKLSSGVRLAGAGQREPKIIPARRVRHQLRLSDAFVLRISDEKTIVVVVVDGMTDVDLAVAELNPAQLIQFVARVDAFILGHILVFTVAAGRGNHVSPLMDCVWHVF